MKSYAGVINAGEPMEKYNVLFDTGIISRFNFAQNLGAIS